MDKGRTDVGARLVGEIGGGDRLRVGAGSRNVVLRDDDVAVADLGEDLGSSLEHEAVRSTRQLDDNSHRLALRTERNHVDDLGSLARRLVVVPAEVLREPEKRRLSLAADEASDLAMLVGALERSRVDRD